MQFKIERNHGFLVLVIMSTLGFFGWPINKLHELIMKLFCSRFLKNLLWKGWGDEEVEGLYIELWTLFWFAANTFLILPYIAGHHSSLTYIFMAIVVVRTADLLWASSAMNLLLSGTPQRSLARSYVMLGLVFFEMAAIFSSLHFFVTTQFTIDRAFPTWQNVYFYTIRNMLTVGGGDIAVSNVSDTNSIFFFYALRVAQPLFSVFLVSMGINQVLNGKGKERITGVGPS